MKSGSRSSLRVPAADICAPMLQRSNLLARPCQPYTLGLSDVSASCADSGCAMVNLVPVTNSMVDIH
eukprot:4147599-Prymnesium_polylepis.1